MKRGTKNLLRIVISIVYIAWGILSPLSALRAVVALDLPALASAAVGVLMLLAGIFGLIGIKKIKCRLFGVVIFLCSVGSVVLALPAVSLHSIITALLAWLFIVCL